MAEGVAATLEFDTSDALAGVDALEARLDQVTSTFGVGLSQAIDSIAGTPAEISVDQASLTGEVDDALAGVDGTVEAGTETDVSEAEAALAGLGDETVGVEGDPEFAAVDEALASIPDSVQVQVEVPPVETPPGGFLGGAGEEFSGATDGAAAFAGGLLGTASAAKTLTAVGLAGFVTSSVQAFAESEGVTARTEALLRTTGGVANVTADEIERLGSEVQSYSGLSDEAIRQGANLVLTFRQVRNEAGAGNDIFTRTVRVMADLARTGFGDVSSNALRLGRALQDPQRGLTALSRAGVTFTDAQKEAVIAMVESGDQLGAQKLILEEIEAQVGGVAAAYGESLPGQLDLARESFGDWMETVGEVAAEALPLLTGALELLYPALSVVGNTTEGLSTIFGLIPEPVYLAATAIGVLYVAIPRLSAAMAFLAANPLVAALTALGLVATAVGFLTDESTAAADQADAVADAVEGFAESLGKSGNAVRSTTEAIAALRRTNSDLDAAMALNGTTARQVAEEFVLLGGRSGDAGDQYSGLVENLLDGNSALADLRLALLETAEAQVTSAIDTGRLSEAAALAAYEQNRLAEGGTNWLGVLEDLPPSAIRSAEAVREIGEAAASNLPTLGEAISNVREAGEAFGVLEAESDPQRVIDNLQAMVDAFADFTTNIAAIREISPIVAEALAPLGPEIAGTFAAALAEAPPAVTQNLEQVLLAAEQQGLNLTDVLTGSFGGAVDAGAGAIRDKSGGVTSAAAGVGKAAEKGAASGFAGFPDRIGGFADEAVKGIERRRDDARQAGRGLGLGLEGGIGATQAIVAGAARKLAGSAVSSMLGQRSAAHSAGRSVGVALGEGIESGIASMVSSIAAQAAKAVDEAEAAARRAADANSPSRLFARLGRDLGDGLVAGMVERTAAVGAAGDRLIATAADSGVTFASTGLAVSELAAGGVTETIVFETGSIVVDARGADDPDAVAAKTADAVAEAVRPARSRRDVALAQRT